MDNLFEGQAEVGELMQVAGAMIIEYTPKLLLAVLTLVIGLWLQWDMQERVKEAFDANDISIPFPQRDVHLHQTAQPSRATQRVAEPAGAG